MCVCRWGWNHTSELRGRYHGKVVCSILFKRQSDTLVFGTNPLRDKRSGQFALHCLEFWICGTDPFLGGSITLGGSIIIWKFSLGCFFFVFGALYWHKSKSLFRPRFTDHSYNIIFSKTTAMSGFKRDLTDQGVDPAKLGTYFKIWNKSMTFTISLSEQNKLFQADQNLCDIRPTDLGTSGCISRTFGNFLALWGLGNMLSCSTIAFLFSE